MIARGEALGVSEPKMPQDATAEMFTVVVVVI
jgi:hypothetical protein